MNRLKYYETPEYQVVGIASLDVIAASEDANTNPNWGNEEEP